LETIIEVKNLVKNYGDKEILKNISFNINKGEIISIIQDLNIIDNMYVIENVLVPFLNRKNFIQVLFNKFSKQEYERALYCLEKVGISKLAYTKAKYLSGGEKQRVAIARSLAPNVDLILADEPISSLDEKNSTQIMEIFKRINIKKNKTIILNLHNVEVAKKFSDKILALKNGEIFFYKKSAEVNEDDIRKVYQTS